MLTASLLHGAVQRQVFRIAPSYTFNGRVMLSEIGVESSEVAAERLRCIG